MCVFVLALTLSLRAAELPRGLDIEGNVQKLTLGDAIEMLLRNNLEVQFDRVGIKVEQARTRFAWGVFDPVFRLEVGRDSVQRPDITSNIQSADSLFSAAVNTALSSQTVLAIDANTNALRAQLGLDPLAPTPLPDTPFAILPGGSTVVFEQDSDRWDASLAFRSPIGTQLAMTARQSKIRSTFEGDIREITPFYTAFGGFEVRQPLLKDFGTAANLADVRTARINERVAQLTWQNTLNEGLGSVLGNYFDMLYAQADLRVRQDAVAADEKLVQQNQRRTDLGFMSPIDVQQARAQVSLDQEQLILSKNLFLERQFALRRLITSAGEEGASRIYLPVQTPNLVPPAGGRSDFLQSAFQRRPDYLAAVTDAEKQDIRLAFAKNQLWPNLDLVGTYGYNGLNDSWTGSRDSAWHSQAPQWSIGVQFSMPIGRVQNRAQYDAIKGFKEQAILKIKQSELTVTVDVDTALSRIETNRQRVTTARQTRELNEEAVRIGYRRMEEGQISSFDLIETQRKLYDAKSRELGAQADLNKAIVTLWQATGTIVDYTGVEIVPGKRSRDLPEASHTRKPVTGRKTR